MSHREPKWNVFGHLRQARVLCSFTRVTTRLPTPLSDCRRDRRDRVRGRPSPSTPEGPGAVWAGELWPDSEGNGEARPPAGTAVFRVHVVVRLMSYGLSYNDASHCEPGLITRHEPAH